MTSHAILLGPPVKLELRHCAVEHDGGVLLGRTAARRARRAFVPGHRPILDAIEGLQPGEAVRINVDHDPEPLLGIIEETAPAQFAWEPLLEGPDRWVGLIRRRTTGLRSLARRLSPRLSRRATVIGAEGRLEHEIRALAIDLLGPAGPAELSPEAARWLSAAAETAVRAVRDGSLSILVAALDRLVEAAPPSVLAELDEARDRHDIGVM